MSTALGCIYRIDKIEVDVARSCVRRMGVEHVLRYQSFHVLLYLLEQSGKLVSKEELTAKIWNNAAVTDNALTQCIAEIRKALGDDSRHPIYIKTVSKVGYCFVAPVTLFNENSEPVPDESSDDILSVTIADSKLEASAFLETSSHPSTDSALSVTPQASPRSKKKFSLNTTYAALAMCGAFVLLSMLLIGASRRAFHGSPQVAPLTSGRSLVIMYFENESQRSEFDWLKQGLTDMMITDLSRAKELHVLSRQQLATLLSSTGVDGKSTSDQAQWIAQDVHAAEFLTGSFCALNGQFRIDIQLHDTRNGQIIFADHSIFQSPESLLSQVDVLAEHLANAMALNTGTKSNIAEMTTGNVEAYQYYSLGVEKAQQFENNQALSLLKQATQLDPGFAMAYARIGYTYALSDFAPEKGRPYLEKALQLSNHLSEKDRLSIRAWYAISKSDYQTAGQILGKISQLYPHETEAYWSLARLLRAEEHPQEALAILHRGLEANPDDKNLHNTLGFVLLSLHRYPEAIEAFQRYVDLAPDDPNAHDSLGMGYQQSGNYSRAISEYSEALTLNAQFEPSIIHLGDAYYQTWQFEKAIEQYQRYIQVADTSEAQALGYGNLATVYLAMNRFAEAKKAAANEIKNNPNAVWNSLLIAFKESDQATVSRLEKLLFKGIPTQERGTPGDQRTKFYYQAYIDMQEGNTQKALEEFKVALQHLPPSSGIDFHEDCLANAELQLGHFKEAAAEYKRILALNPNYPLARMHLAQAEAHLGGQRHAL